MERIEEDYDSEIKYLFEKIMLFLEDNNISLKTTEEFFYDEFKKFFFDNSTLV